MYLNLNYTEQASIFLFSYSFIFYYPLPSFIFVLQTAESRDNLITRIQYTQCSQYNIALKIIICGMRLLGKIFVLMFII